jgi:flagellar export protein FliJ
MAQPFRLQSVWRLRSSLQDERQAELGQAVQAEQILLNQIRETEQRLVDIEQQLRLATQQHLDVDHLMALRRFQADTRHLGQQLEQQRGQVVQEIERRQLRLAEARREVKVIETLAEQHRLTQQRLDLTREQAALDEFAQKRTMT